MKNSFFPKFGQKGPKWPHDLIIGFFLSFSFFFLGSNLKWKLILFIIQQECHIWQNSGSPLMDKPIKLQGSLKYDISRNKCMMNFIFEMQINIEVFYKLILSFWLCITRHAQITQKKLTYLCSISRKAWVMKLIFCL